MNYTSTLLTQLEEENDYGIATQAASRATGRRRRDTGLSGTGLRYLNFSPYSKQMDMLLGLKRFHISSSNSRHVYKHRGP